MADAIDDASAGRPARSGRVGPTIRDVATRAGVSIGTVSKALNRNGSLKAETREKVIAAAQEIGFRPNDLAQALHRGQSFTVGLISNDSFGRFTMPIMEGLEAVLTAEGIAVFMCNATDDPERERQHLEQLMGKRVDGLVITSRRADRRPPLPAEIGKLPVIYVYSQSADSSAFCLLPDEEAGAAEAVRHLIRLGRRRIAHVTGPERFEAVLLRHAGYRGALAEAGLDEPETGYLPGAWSEAWGREAVDRLLAEGREPIDAVFCGNDQIARGVLDQLRDRGIAVPDTVAVVGFDNWGVMAEAARPPLTSVDMDLHRLGEAAGRHIMGMVGGEHFSGVLRLPCSLVIRQSCGAAAAGQTQDNKDAPPYA